MYALITEQGTAAAESALCNECYSNLENKQYASDQASHSGDVIPGSWQDVTGNEALSCVICGKDENALS